MTPATGSHPHLRSGHEFLEELNLLVLIPLEPLDAALQHAGDERHIIRLGHLQANNVASLPSPMRA